MQKVHLPARYKSEATPSLILIVELYLGWWEVLGLQPLCGFLMFLCPQYWDWLVDLYHLQDELFFLSE